MLGSPAARRGDRSRTSSPSPTRVSRHSDTSGVELVPVHRGKDSKGPYYQWGESGKKYHYESGDKESRDEAKEKARRQGRAAHAAGYRD
jgi:hypothetical protein